MTTNMAQRAVICLMEVTFADFAHHTLKPLSWTRSVVDVEVGGATIGAHGADRYPGTEPVDIFVPSYLRPITRVNDRLYGFDRNVIKEIPAGTVVANPAMLPKDDIVARLSELRSGDILVQEGTPVALRTDRTVRTWGAFSELVKKYDTRGLGESVLNLSYPWGLDRANEVLLTTAIGSCDTADASESINCEIVGERGAVHVGSDVEVSPSVTIDTTDGPVYLGDCVVLNPNTRIEGPAYVGDWTLVGAGDNAVIHGGTHVGRVCRVGGEVGRLILHSFSNKYHFGFLGHAVIGSWVNIGAGTTNSDLKNTYGTVTVAHPTEGEINVGQKFGTAVGDHTKLGINTAIHTGKQIGPCVSVVGRVNDDLPPFTWLRSETSRQYDSQRAVEHAQRMMTRREQQLPEDYIDIQSTLIATLSDRLQGDC